MSARGGLAAVASIGALVLGAASARADLPPAGPALPVFSNFGRLIAPVGQLTQLGYFPVGATLTPDGRFVWTINAGRRNNSVQISDVATGAIVQTLDDGKGKEGGVVISHDGLHAYVSEPPGDKVLTFAVDPTTGHATPGPEIGVPPPPDAQPPDDFPPRASGAQSYPAGLALSGDDRTLVAALNLSDRVALIDTGSRTVMRQLRVRTDGSPGDRAHPEGVAVAGHTAIITDEGDGTIASLDLTNPTVVTRVTPGYADPSGVNPKRTHPSGIVVTPDGKHAFVSLTSADQVLELDTAVLSRVEHRFDLRRSADMAAGTVGAQPVGVALTPDAQTLLVADFGEDVVRAIALSSRTIGEASAIVPSTGSPATTGSAIAGTPPPAGVVSRHSDASTPTCASPPRRHRRRGSHGGRRSSLARSALSHAAAVAAAAGKGLRRRRAHRKRAARPRAQCRHAGVGRPRKAGHRRRRARSRAASVPIAATARRTAAVAGTPGPRASVTPRSTLRVVSAGDEIARIPTGIAPRQVLMTPDSGRLVVVDSKGVGPGSTFDAQESVSTHILGALERIDLPAGQAARDAALVGDGAGGEQTPVPVASQNGGQQPPSGGSPLVGSGGGASDRIKYVFYVVTENKTYDSVLGDLSPGNGDPCLALFGEYRVVHHHPDGSDCPTSRFGANPSDVRTPGLSSDGTPITPNEHALARQFVTLDNTSADSVTSDDGHIWTSSAYAPEYDLRATEANNGLSPRPFDLLYGVSAPPKGFFFDSAVRQGISFFNYGEAAAGLAVPDTQATPQETAIRNAVKAKSEFTTQYPSSGAIDVDPITKRETLDHDPAAPVDPTKQVSRMRFFRRQFAQQQAACPTPSDPTTCMVPRYNELLFPNNHTSGMTPGRRTPDALVRDTDKAIGQLVSDLSHSKIWPYTAVFLVQDDAQSGADHVEGHRITSLVASPYARRGVIDSTHYDQVSVIRTIELILGMKPTYLYDALARPMWSSFQSTADLRPYTPPDIPEALTNERNVASTPATRAGARMSAPYDWRVADSVPEGVVNRVTWAYRFGTAAACPARVGIVPYAPCAPTDQTDSRAEVAKARATVQALRVVAGHQATASR